MASNNTEQDLKVEDRLIQYGLERKNKHLKLITKRTLDELDNSYHPDVGEKSQIMAAIKRRNRTPGRKHNKSHDVAHRSENVESDDSYYPSKSFVTDSDISFTNMKKAAHNMSFSGQGKSTSPQRKIDTSQISNSLIRKQYCDSKVYRVKTKPKVYKNTELHEFLHQEADIKRYKQRMKELDYMKKVYPFTPTLSEKAKHLEKEDKSQFIDRLVYSKRIVEEIVIREKKPEEKNLFKPTISSYKSTREAIAPGDTFYDQRLINQKSKIQNKESKSNLEKKKLWLETSMKSVLKMKIDRYKEIFDLLDSDRDGFISSQSIKLSELDAGLLKSLSPLLQELQTNNKQMDFNQFCVEADKHLPVKVFK
jgi:hypothetical protein